MLNVPPAVFRAPNELAADPANTLPVMLVVPLLELVTPVAKLAVPPVEFPVMLAVPVPPLTRPALDEDPPVMLPVTVRVPVELVEMALPVAAVALPTTVAELLLAI
jgi:hypothetical protein